jgi:hypothetical protein
MDRNNLNKILPLNLKKDEESKKHKEIWPNMSPENYKGKTTITDLKI